MVPISVLILTFNEELHIARALENLKDFGFVDIHVVDSYSTDQTVSIVRDYPCQLYFHEFVDYSAQLRWSLVNCAFRFPFVFRLDADEVLLTANMQDTCDLIQKYNGLTVSRQYWFLGKQLRSSGIGVRSALRIFRAAESKVSARRMDEKVLVNGDVGDASICIADINLKSLSSFIDKHLRYARLEAEESLDNCNTRQKLYYFSPIFFRPVVLFLVRIGSAIFFDGWRGLIFVSIQTLFYRTMVDFFIFKKYLCVVFRR